jgi:hypothetical protein
LGELALVGSEGEAAVNLVPALGLCLDQLLCM